MGPTRSLSAGIGWVWGSSRHGPASLARGEDCGVDKAVLITGGAGFIGSHVADELLEHGYRVRALDALVPQVHGVARPPDHLNPEVELAVGEVHDPDVVARGLRGIDAVVHGAAAPRKSLPTAPTSAPKSSD
jgi:nucleoside-diphosphate-sugar epimerase